MKGLIILVCSVFATAAGAEEFLPKESCNGSSNRSECRKLSHGVTAIGAGTALTTGIRAGQAFAAADSLVENNIDLRYNGTATAVNDALISDLGSNIDKDAHVQIAYYLNPAENKELHIGNAQEKIRDLERKAESFDDDAERAMRRERAVYIDKEIEVRDQNGNVTSRSSEKVFSHNVPDPDYHGAEVARKSARRVRSQDIPRAEARLRKVRATDPKDLQLLEVEKKLEATDKGGNVNSFLAKMKERDYKILRMTQVRGTVVRAARRLGKKGWIGVAVTSGTLALSAVEAFTGTAGRTIQDGKNTIVDGLEMVDVSQ